MGRYISKPQLTEDERDLVELRSGSMTEETRDTTLLLRELLALGILSFILEKKRWRVDYGLDSVRQRPTQLTVPFRAKDLPTDRSEFSHPDVVIALTSLSYYYVGLSDDNLVLSILAIRLLEDETKIKVRCPYSFQATRHSPMTLKCPSRKDDGVDTVLRFGNQPSSQPNHSLSCADGGHSGPKFFHHSPNSSRPASRDGQGRAKM